MIVTVQADHILSHTLKIDKQKSYPKKTNLGSPYMAKCRYLYSVEKKISIFRFYLLHQVAVFNI